MLFCCGGKMPVYAVVARTQTPLSGSWGARLLTPILRPGIENKNIMFPCQRAYLTIRLFTPPTTRCRYILLKKSFRGRTVPWIFLSRLFLAASSLLCLFWIYEYSCLGKGTVREVEDMSYFFFQGVAGLWIRIRNDLFRLRIWIRQKVPDPQHWVDIRSLRLLCTHRVNCTSTLTNVQKRHPLPLSS